MTRYYQDRFGLSDAFLKVPEHAIGRPQPFGLVACALTVKGIRIDDTFAEAFGMRATAVVITADSARWARQARADDDRLCHLGDRLRLRGGHRPRARRQGHARRAAGRACAPGSRSRPPSCRSSCRRVAQCVLTSPGSACYAGLDGEEALRLGNALRYFGDGWQIAKRLGAKRYWRLPVMDGEFVCEATTGLTKQAVGGGNLLIAGRTAPALAAAEAAAAAIAAVPDVIAPFPAASCAPARRSAQVQGRRRVDQRRLLPDAARRGRHRPRRRHRGGAGDRDRRAHLGGGGGDARRPRRDRVARPEARRGAGRRRQLRRQAQAAPLSGPAAVSPLVLTMRGAPDRGSICRPWCRTSSPARRRRRSKIELQTTRTPVTVGDLFRLRMGDAAHIRIEGSGERLDRIGHAMTERRDRGRGRRRRAGRPADARRQPGGPRRRRLGLARRWPAGRSRSCDAGDHLGGPFGGETVGMRGGAIVVRGSGARAADRMRREPSWSRAVRRLCAAA
jgi:hypothetical protein